MARKSRRHIIDAPTASMPNSKVYNTAIYARLSIEDSGKHDNNDSIDNQIYLVTRFIEERPYLKLCAVYSDNGETGVNFDRPQFNEMMNAVKAGKIDCIAVKDLSRFGRNYIETGNFLEKIFPFLGVRFISVNDNYDTSNPDSSFDSLSISLKSLINDIYAKDISRKVTAALETKQKNGDFIGSFAAYGYMKSAEDEHKLVIDEKVSPIVLDIYRLKSEGMGNNAIARRLNDMGMRRTGGKNPRYNCDTPVSIYSPDCVQTEMSESLIEEVLLSAIQSQATLFGEKEKVRQKKHKAMTTRLSDIRQSIRQFEETIQKLNVAKQEHYENYKDGRSTKDEYMFMRMSCNKQIDEVTASIAELTEKLVKTSVPDAQESAAHCKWQNCIGISELNREIVDALVDNIIVYDSERIEIVWKLADEYLS